MVHTGFRSKIIWSWTRCCSVSWCFKGPDTLYVDMWTTELQAQAWIVEEFVEGELELFNEPINNVTRSGHDLSGDLIQYVRGGEKK